jgi:hypothetical protein
MKSPPLNSGRIAVIAGMVTENDFPHCRDVSSAPSENRLSGGAGQSRRRTPPDSCPIWSTTASLGCLHGETAQDIEGVCHDPKHRSYCAARKTMTERLQYVGHRQVIRSAWADYFPHAKTRAAIPCADAALGGIG